MWKPPPGDYFEVKPPQSSGQWGTPSAWTTPNQADVSYQTNIEKKKLFGVALAKQGSNDLQAAFKAGCEVFPDNTNASLWVAHNWLNDIVVIAARDLYADSLGSAAPLLDKEQFAVKVLTAADEKVEQNGKLYHAVEAKDRLGFYRLYSEIMGYTGKTEVNNNFKFTHNDMTIKLVKASGDEPLKTIDHIKEPISDNVDNIIKIKAVK